ncbi:nuclear localization sequence-binding protein [Anaeramoeba flamelloides]|uniref:Nuclear localization sequence-binding protein n=1 Tax=Anaeramoeba flamelloides TaxID=1746091 RepID=A0ABQ8XY07_9EUKA|nr:nuclear localization sequence-binding protein [Anaeramoeba flamelloides]
MFIKPRGILLAQVRFDLNSKATKQPKSWGSNEIVEWVSNLLQYQDLTKGELFSNGCLYLLNILNVVRPARINQVSVSTTKKNQEKENFEEYVQSLTSYNYKKANGMRFEFFQKQDKQAHKEVMKSLLWLKKEYDKYGIIKDESRVYRKYQILQSKHKQSIPHLRLVDSQVYQMVKNTPRIIKNIDSVNPYLTIGKFDPDLKSNTFENIFWFGQEERSNILMDIKKELGDENNYPSSDYSEDSQIMSYEPESEDLFGNTEITKLTVTDKSSSEASNSESNSKSIDLFSSSLEEEVFSSSSEEISQSDSMSGNQELKGFDNKKYETENEKEKEQEQEQEKKKQEEEYENIDYWNPQSVFLIEELTTILKLKRVPQKKANYIYIIYFLLNIFDKWLHNDFCKIKDYPNQNLINKYNNLIQQIFNDKKIHLWKKKIHFFVHIKNHDSKKKILNFDQPNKSDRSDEFEIEKNEKRGTNTETNPENEEENQEVEKDQKNYSANGFFNLTKKRITITTPKGNREIFNEPLTEKIQIGVHKKSTSKLRISNLQNEIEIKFLSEDECLSFIACFLIYISNNKKFKKKTLKRRKTARKKNGGNEGNPGNINTNEDNNDPKTFFHNNIKKAIPNKRFLKKMSSIQEVKDKSNVLTALNKYYLNNGVNFLLKIIIDKDPQDGYIQIQKKNLLLGIKKKIIYKIPYAFSPAIYKNPEKLNEFFIQWSPDSSCRIPKVMLISIMCSTTPERSLIQQSIIFFLRKFKKGKK